jgi:hypothetical protein
VATTARGVEKFVKNAGGLCIKEPSHQNMNSELKEPENGNIHYS